MYIYWSVPSESYGDISYRIINNDTKEEEPVATLPYTCEITASSIPKSFSVITRCKIKDIVYESDPVQILTKNIDSKM